MESLNNDDDAFRPAEPSLRTNLPPSNPAGNNAPGDFQRDIRKSRSWVVVFRIGLVIVALSLIVSCLAAPFLVPFFQLFLVPPILGAIALGAMGGYCRRWWVTILVWSLLLSIYVGYDLMTDQFGYKSLYATYILKTPPPGFDYYHSWQQLYQVTIIPLTLGVAVMMHGWVAERRRTGDHSRSGGPANAAVFVQDED